MKISPDCKAELVTSDDKKRYALTEPYLDVPGKRLIATDGRMLAITPVTVDDGDVSGYVPAAALELARKDKTRKGLSIEINCADPKTVGVNTPNGNGTFPRLQDLTYPPVDQVMPKADCPAEEEETTFAINPEMLWRLAQGLGLNKKSTPCQLVLTVRKSKADGKVLGPIKVSTKQGTGCIMPMRIS